MSAAEFARLRDRALARHAALVSAPNAVDDGFYNGIYERFVHPVLTADHVPVDWRYDMHASTNPYFMERLGVNAVFNAGAMCLNGKALVVARVEGLDRKSFLAIAESDTGVDGFRFWPEPILLPDAADPETNVYDMRLTSHEDGWIYGLFCAERKDPAAPPGDLSSAVATCGVARTRDLRTWDRLPDVVSKAQQRNMLLHPEFVDGQYAFYTRPSDTFITVGGKSGIGWALSKSMESIVIEDEPIIEPRVYHTITEVKNGAGATPIKTPKGWLHVAHGVRNTAAGLRYVIYAFLTDLARPDRVAHRPGGYLIAPRGEERVGDVSNVAFINGAAEMPNGDLLLYYASSDTRLHVARTSVDRMVDYCVNTPPDGLRSRVCVEQRLSLIRRNRE